MCLTLSACDQSLSEASQLSASVMPTTPLTVAPETFTIKPSTTDTSGQTSETPYPSPIPPSAILPKTLACLKEKGLIEKGALDSDLLRQPLEYSLYLPPCYRLQNNRRYPTLYLIHGQSYTDDQWLRLGAAEIADTLIQRGEIPPLIIVMPRDRAWEQPTQDKFGQVLVDQLIPYIDQTYPTLSGRRYRVIGGLSRGAGWAIHLGLSHWELFSAIGGHSLAVFWTDTPHIPGWLDSIPPQSLPRIYLDIGDKDRPAILNSAIWFEELLTRKNIPHEWYLFSGYHEEAYWRAHLEQYLRWYALEW